MNTQASVLILLLTLALPTALFAEASKEDRKNIYVWIDEHGNKVYGDAPDKKANAEAVDMKPLNILGFPELKDSPPPAKAKQNVSGAAYTVFDITSPGNEASIRDNLGNVKVTFNIEPALDKGHSIQLYLNASAYQEPKTSTSILMENIDRGTHTIQAKLLDSNGEVIRESSSVRFHLHRFFQKPSQ